MRGQASTSGCKVCSAAVVALLRPDAAAACYRVDDDEEALQREPVEHVEPHPVGGDGLARESLAESLSESFTESLVDSLAERFTVPEKTYEGRYGSYEP